ncbi:energy-coupling factor transporter transmembrane component T family protein [Oryzobacter terrae]|uniref:energy-coupling factor transporter transmembrane component T family protein n=1 Tax=Oryzobacter terrae TaxID=1620385 RepID=UPI00366F08FD
MSALLTFVPGSSPIHRVPAGPKVVALGAVSIATLVVRSPWGIAVLFALAVAGFAVARIPRAVVWGQLRLILPLVIVLLAYQWYANGLLVGLRVVGGLASVILLASLVSLTTPASHLIDLAVRVAAPLRVFGVDPDRLGLAAALAVRSVAVIHGLAGEVREAQVARGGGMDPRVFAVPLVVRSLRQADELADALVARGVDD